MLVVLFDNIFPFQTSLPVHAWTLPFGTTNVKMEQKKSKDLMKIIFVSVFRLSIYFLFLGQIHILGQDGNIDAKCDGV